MFVVTGSGGPAGHVTFARIIVNAAEMSDGIHTVIGC